MAFDGIVLSRVTEALKKEIVTGRISKIYQVSRYELLMIIRVHQTNKKLLISIHPVYARIQVSELDYPTPDFPNAMTMLLRKHLEGSFIEDIEQIGLNRILKMTIRGRNEFKDDVRLFIYIEIMGKHSNFILTNEEHKILECLKRVSPSESRRIMQPGIIYQLPPLIEKKDPFTSDLVTSDYLVSEFEGFSKDLSNEVLTRLHHGEVFTDIMNQIKQSDHLYISNGQRDRYHVIPLTHLEEPVQEYDLFTGLDQYYNLIDQKDRIKQQTSDLARYINQEYTKNVNKLNKLEKTLFDSQNSDEFRIKGDLLFASLHLITKGMKEVTVDNYYDGTKMTIELDERFDGKQNAKRYYAKYQKAKNALKVLDEQIALTKEEIDYFDTLKTMLENANYYDALEIKEELENLGYLRKKKVKKLKKASHPHYEVYRTKDDVIIYVGKNNLQNDYLTFKMASRSDIWFHVKEMPGSHVIVHQSEPDEYTIRKAAMLAAWYSKGRHSSSVPVNYAPVRTLKKPHTNKPGMVLLGHYKTIYIDPEESVFDDLNKEA
ncbi:MAG: NFACT family protein [Erysipelotrichaceae bacterium]|nr:NFACT family protein [Erysipelotrichaceae bacterium]